jgi:hypothetical protein
MVPLEENKQKKKIEEKRKKLILIAPREPKGQMLIANCQMLRAD